METIPLLGHLTGRLLGALCVLGVPCKRFSGTMPGMYEEFDQFLQRTTWHTRHATDEEQFFAALRRVVTDRAFNPEKMGEYMTARGQGSLNEEALGEAVEHYVAAAWAVRRYLQLD